MSAIGKLNLNGTGYEFATPTDEQTQTAVNAWLDDHPEATTTVQDGSITLAKLSANVFDPINVLLLGVDNTGSSDCSAILNNYTGSQSLYFPEGQYLIENTLNLKVSIIGAKYLRHPNGNAATLVQGSNADPVIKYNCDSTLNQKGIVAKDIDIKMTQDGTAINCGLRSGSYQFTFDHVSIRGLENGYGMYFSNSSTLASRSVYLSNIFIVGNTCAFNSTGIYIGENIGDLQFDTIEIMCVRRGMNLRYGVHNIVNCHIWTGISGDSEATAEDASNTDGITLGNQVRLNASNLYLDTCFVGMRCGTDCIANISNFTYWDDGSLSELITEYGSAASLFYAAKDNHSKVHVENAIIKIPSHGFVISSKWILAEVSGGLRLYIETYANDSLSNSALKMIRQIADYTIVYSIPDYSRDYVPVAMLKASQRSIGKFKVCGGTGIIDTVSYDINTNGINSLTATRGGYSTSTAYKLQYKIIGKFIAFFVKCPFVATFDISQHVQLIESDGYSVLVDPYAELFYDKGVSAYEQLYKSEAEATGFTELTYS